MGISVDDRFWSKVDRAGPLPTWAPFLGPCWLWTTGKRGGGYGRFKFGGQEVMSHRFAYEALVAPIPDGLEIDHLCRVRACVNPGHLEAVTHQENIHRTDNPPARNFRKTHCLNGHPFDEENTYIPKKSGYRECRACRRAAMARWSARQAWA